VPEQSFFSCVASPIGELLLTSNGEAVTRISMMPWSANEQSGRRDDVLLGPARQQLLAYFAGELLDFDLPLAAAGTPFQQKVWSALCGIPYGETVCYAEIARRIGIPAASRAVGAANGRNPIALVVPCHRVIGKDGTLTGYGGGLDRKQGLLRHAAAVHARQGLGERANAGYNDDARPAEELDFEESRHGTATVLRFDGSI
jgi:methylated-DNA-[protein]-cysteine S-methyltransferase